MCRPKKNPLSKHWSGISFFCVESFKNAPLGESVSMVGYLSSEGLESCHLHRKKISGISPLPIVLVIWVGGYGHII